MRWGVESICTQLTELGVPIAPSTYYDHINREPSRRELRDGELKEHISRVHAANYGVYGARKVWLTLNREGIEVARCTVERLMTKLGLSGTTRGKARRTTIADPATARPADLVQRRFGPPAPNRLWVADLTYVSTWAGFAYVAFVTDAYARRILGWRVASTMATSMVLDAIEQAIWTRQQEGVLDLKDVIHHTDRGSQYTSIRFSERLAEAGIQPSVGAVGSSYDNALAETINGLYKTELIKPGKPWRSRRKGPPFRAEMGCFCVCSAPVQEVAKNSLRGVPESVVMSYSYFVELPRLEDIEPGAHTDVLIANSRVDQGRIRTAVEAVFDAHPALGTVFEPRVDTLTSRPGGGGWGWGVEPPGAAVAEVIARHSASFDMYTGRLFAVSLLPGSPDRLVLTASRLCVDDASWQTVVEDLVRQYDENVLVPAR
ncbi:is6110, transposase [Mycobacterium canettii CIPT 140010059]|nr:is6110, transposase [Mycobacterium canettii CIPT 140010059]